MVHPKFKNGRVYPTKNTPTAGQIFGKLTVLFRVTDKNTKTANLKVQVRVKCECGQRFTLPYFYLIRTHIAPRQDCGTCGPLSFKSLHPLSYNSWYMMNFRCTETKHVAYKYYGGRGIQVDPDWSWDNPLGFENFVRDMGDRPSTSLSIDRKDNNGHYTLSNCRWATAAQQRANQGHGTVFTPGWQHTVGETTDDEIIEAILTDQTQTPSTE